MKAEKKSIPIDTHKPLLIAGPCMAESMGLLDETAGFLKDLCARLGYSLVFKSSFDKANRSAGDSERGPGLEKALQWFEDLQNRYVLPTTTDVHETYQVKPVAEVVDVLQIPAFLCRQTDLLLEAATRARRVSVKKAQFLSPYAMEHVVEKVRSVDPELSKLWLIERGSMFGYGNLVVDFKSFPILHGFKPAQTIFDLTHSLQSPSTGKTTGGDRQFALPLARAAVATGYIDGIFMEVHPNPAQAKSDKDTQLNFDQATHILAQVQEYFAIFQNLAKQDAV